MTDQHSQDDLALPAILKRTAKPATTTTAAPEAAKVKPVQSKEAKAAARSAKARTKAAAKATAKAEPKHRPSTVKSTDANPSKSIVPVRFKERYADHDDTNGDKVALALKSATETTNADGRTVLDVPALTAIAKANGIDFTRYEKLNNGQKRMNVGNRLRGLLKAGKKVMIGKQVFADAKKALAVQPVKEAAAAA